MNYITFYKNIIGKNIFIFIEFDFYNLYNNIFDGIFVSFKKVQVNENVSDEFCCIYKSDRDKSNIIYDSKSKIFKIECDIYKGDWVHKLIVMLEDFFIKTTNVTVFHGSSILYDEKTILLLGERMSGKSTLMNYLLNDGGYIIDDDCIYYDNGIIYGFNLPVRMRMCPEQKKDILCESEDGDGGIRFLVKAQKRISCSRKNAVIIFPKYSSGDKCNIKLIQGNEKFLRLIKNTKNSKNNKVRLNDLSRIAKSVPSYEIRYADCEAVKFFLKNFDKKGEG